MAERRRRIVNLMVLFTATKRLIAGFAIGCLLTMAGSVAAQNISEGPIKKENLLKTLESMQARKSKRKSVAWYIEILKEHKVGFQLTTETEKEIRRNGSYLGKKGLDSLIAAVRDNYNKIEEKPNLQVDRESKEPTRQAEPPLPVQRLFASAEKISSTRENLPYALSVIIQTTTILSPTHIAVVCDAPIGDAEVMFSPPPGASGSFSNMWGKITRIYGNTYEFSFENPPFSPKRPLEVKVYSVRQIRLVAVKQLD